MNPTSNLKNRLEWVRARVVEAAGARAPAVSLLAVSKGQSAQAIAELYQFGQRDFAENYAQELISKAGDLKTQGCAEIRWHFIGHLQTNKVRAVLPWVRSVHSVDSEKLALELSRRWIALRGESTELLEVFVEVNIGSENSKAGVRLSEVTGLVEKISKLPGLSLQGLMCIPAPGEGPASFQKLRDLEKKLRPMTHEKLSMGMSEDFEEAIQAGATHVRVGTAIFGPRNP
ncbi:MAG: YggS family pyridoxal phosphate-dependent enzyme [Bdellovibrionota bacterium]